MGDVERLEALLPELLDGHILANLHAAANLHPQFPEDLDFSVNHIFFQLVGGDAVGHHAAGPGILFKHRGQIARVAR